MTIDIRYANKNHTFRSYNAYRNRMFSLYNYDYDNKSDNEFVEMVFNYALHGDAAVLGHRTYEIVTIAVKQ